MPFQYSEQFSKSGMRYLRVDGSGHVSLDDAKEFEAMICKPEWRDALVLSVVAKGTDYSPESRRHFPTLNDKLRAIAVVVTSPLVRTAINMMVRFGRAEDRAPMRLFTDEAEAIAWLESRQR
jgi:hypothetical protein